MKKMNSYYLCSLFLLITVVGFVGCDASSHIAHEMAPVERPQKLHLETEELKGPNGGRLLLDGNFAIEVTIFETGVDPQFRLYAYQNNERLSPDEVQVTLELERLGGKIDRFSFTPQADYLVGDGIVTEPHSFVVSVSATHNDRVSSWRYDSFEGRVEIADAMAKAAGIETDIAGPATLDVTVPVTGKIDFAPSAVAEIASPYPAKVLSVSASLGDTVRRGETLVRLENVTTLQPFELIAPSDGVVIERNTNVGDVTGAEALFVLADTAQMEARLHVFPQDKAIVMPGMSVFVQAPMNGVPVETEIIAYKPMADAISQTLIARAPVPEGASFYPGLRVNGEIVVETIEAPLAVRTSALQRFRDFTVVFAKVGETYEVRMLDLGARNRDWVIVHGGLEPGTEYVVSNAFLLKADVEKDGASHDH